MGIWDMKQCPQQRVPEWAVEAGADGGSWGTEALSGEMTGGLGPGVPRTRLSLGSSRWSWRGGSGQGRKTLPWEPPRSPH